jgi:hypothetical protein
MNSHAGQRHPHEEQERFRHSLFPDKMKCTIPRALYKHAKLDHEKVEKGTCGSVMTDCSH